MEAVRSTTGERSLLAIVAGAGVGGLLSGLFVAISSALTPPADLDPVLFVAVTVAAALVWLVFILVLGVFLGSALWWLILVHITLAARRKLSAKAIGWIDALSGALLLAWGLWLLLGALSALT